MAGVTFQVGVVWPLPWPLLRLDRVWLRALKVETAATHLRVNLDVRNPHAGSVITMARDEGFAVLPVMDLDYDALARPGWFSSAAWPQYVNRCVELAGQYRLTQIEILNEPDTLHKIPPVIYATVVNEVGRQVHQQLPGTQVVVAGEILRPHRKGPTPQPYFDRVRAGLIPDYHDVVGIHHYRDPGPPSATRFGSRRAEHRHVQAAARHKPIMTTEIGWDLPRLERDEGRQADYVYEELVTSRELGLLGCYIYAHQEDPALDYGIMRRDRRPRPAAHAIRRFVQDLECAA